MENSYSKHCVRKITVLIALWFLFSISAYASTTGTLPFNTTMQNFQINFMAWIFVTAVLLWVATCLMLAMGDWGDGIKRLINIIFWFSLCLAGGTGFTAIFTTGAVF